jgi:hypothetical protein
MSDSEEISTEPGTASTPGAGGGTSLSGQSSQRSPSRALLLLKVVHVTGALGLAGWNIPFAQRQWAAGDRWPMIAIAAVTVMIATRMGAADVIQAAKQLLPWGKGGSK